MERVIQEFSHGRGQVTRITISDFKGKKYVDIRKFYKGATQWEPTRKGYAIPADKLSEYINVLEKAEAEIKN